MLEDESLLDAVSVSVLSTAFNLPAVPRCSSHPVAVILNFNRECASFGEAETPMEAWSFLLTCCLWPWNAFNLPALPSRPSLPFSMALAFNRYFSSLQLVSAPQ